MNTQQSKSSLPTISVTGVAPTIIDNTPLRVTFDCFKSTGRTDLQDKVYRSSHSYAYQAIRSYAHTTDVIQDALILLLEMEGPNADVEWEVWRQCLYQASITAKRNLFHRWGKTADMDDPESDSRVMEDDEAIDPLNLILASEERGIMGERIKNAFATCPPRRLEALMLQMKGMSLKEIADVMDITVGGVGAHISYARDHFENILGGAIR